MIYRDAPPAEDLFEPWLLVFHHPAAGHEWSLVGHGDDRDELLSHLEDFTEFVCKKVESGAYAKKLLPLTSTEGLLVCVIARDSLPLASLSYLAGFQP